MEKTATPLVDFIVHMYRINDMIVIFTKLYLTAIYRETVSCIETLFLGGEELDRSAYEVVLSLYMYIAFCKAECIIVIIFTNKATKRNHIHTFEMSCLLYLCALIFSLVVYISKSL